MEYQERRPAASAGPLWVSGEYANAPKANALKNTTETGLEMRIDFLKYLVPSEYKFRQFVLDTMFRIAKANPKPTCHQEEIAKATNAKKEKIETVILYLVRNDYAKHVGNHGEPLYSVTGKGQSASIDREFLHTGRNERYKNVLAYGAWLGLISTTLAITTALYIAPRMVRLEKRIESMEQHVSQQSKASTREKAVHSSQSEQSLQKVDSVSLSRDSAMLRTAGNEKPNP